MSFKARSKPESVVYHAIVPYYKWMNGASLELYRSDYGCCNTLLAEWNDPLGSYVEALPFSPQLLYIHRFVQSSDCRLSLRLFVGHSAYNLFQIRLFSQSLRHLELQ